MAPQKLNLPINIGLFIISGVAAAFGQPDRGLLVCLLGFAFGYSGIFYLLRKLERGRVLVAFLFPFGVFGFQLNWLATIHYHGIGIVFVYALAVAIFAGQFAVLFGLGIGSFFSWRRGLFLASMWTLIEWSRLYYFCGFPFSTVGLLLTSDPLSMQMASVLGVYALSFWVIFTSYLMAFEKLKNWGACFVLPFVLGWAHMHYWEGKRDTGLSFDVALIQTGVMPGQKWGFEGKQLSLAFQWERIFTFLEETKKKSFDWIVLPEVAMTGDVRANLDMAEKLARSYQSDVIIGLVDGLFNAAFHINPIDSIISRYEKRVLVPGAEYLPFSGLKNFFARYGITSFFTPGTEAKVFMGKIPFAVSICYEEGFAHLIREGRELGAKLFLNISNDGWFPKSRLPEEHFNLGRVRAVENGVFVLRACNTGVTGAIDPFGRVLCAMKEKEGSGVQVVTIDGYSYPTIFSKWGHVPILSFCCLWVFVNCLIKRKRLSRLII